eukprot:COSAG01_NODE_9355_length_2471_cov_23.244941_3_plen_248_part_00
MVRAQLMCTCIGGVCLQLHDCAAGWKSYVGLLVRHMAAWFATCHALRHGGTVHAFAHTSYEPSHNRPCSIGPRYQVGACAVALRLGTAARPSIMCVLGLATWAFATGSARSAYEHANKSARFDTLGQHQNEVGVTASGSLWRVAVPPRAFHLPDLGAWVFERVGADGSAPAEKATSALCGGDLEVERDTGVHQNRVLRLTPQHRPRLTPSLPRTLTHACPARSGARAPRRTPRRAAHLSIEKSLFAP